MNAEKVDGGQSRDRVGLTRRGASFIAERRGLLTVFPKFPRHRISAGERRNRGDAKLTWAARNRGAGSDPREMEPQRSIVTGVTAELGMTWVAQDMFFVLAKNTHQRISV